MGLTPATNRQVPDNAILDAFNKQTYLGNQFAYSLGNTEITSTSETPLILIENPTVATSSFPSGYVALFSNIRKLTCITTSQTALFRFYVNPTVTGAGTTQSVINLRPASATTSIATVTLSPSVSSNGTLFDSVASTAFVTSLSSSLAILDPGQNMLVTVQTSSATTFISATLGWWEL